MKGCGLRISEEALVLILENLCAGYGEGMILRDFSLRAKAGSAIALVGRNGAGKSTALKAIMGLVRTSGGSVSVSGRGLSGLSCYDRASAGISYVPETRNVFHTLTVAENLVLAWDVGRRRQGAWTPDRVLALFPALAARQRHVAAALSGGEQQMVAVARGFLMNGTVLLLDEPREGLAPSVAAAVYAAVAEVKKAGMVVIVVEQALRFAAAVADQVYVVGNGCVRWSGSPAMLSGAAAMHRRWLGVGAEVREGGDHESCEIPEMLAGT